LNGKFAVEFFDTVSGAHTRVIDLLPEFQRAKGNLAFSPDGRWMAAAIKTADGPATLLTDVSGPRAAGRIYPLPALGAVKIATFSGLDFSPDSARFALLYEEAGNWLIVSFKPPDTKQTSTYTVFTDRQTGATTEYHGEAFDWLPDGVAQLIYGRTVVESGHILGELGVPDVKGHHVLDKDSIAVLVPGAAEGKLRLQIVKLNWEKLSSLETQKPQTPPRPRP
jgi:hypothetical protein